MKSIGVGLLLCLVGIVSHAETYPDHAGVLNVKAFGATGDGVTDDTAAINAAISASTPAVNSGIYWGQAKIVYLPSGTYLISAPLIKNNAAGDPTYGMVLIGQSQATTTILLAAGAASFQDSTHPQGMIHPSSDAGAGWSPVPGDGNAAYQNTIQDLTVDIGSGNPGAIGIDYLASNLGAIRNVTVQAASGTAGVTGIRMTRQDIGPALLENVTVNGFPIGLDVANLQYSLTLDNVTLNGQTVVGLRNTQNQIAVNALTATTAGPAVVNSSPDGEVVLAGSTLHRATGYSGGLISNSGTIVFRNQNTIDGYQSFAGSSLPGDVVNGMLTRAGFTNGAGGSFNTSTTIVNPPPVIEDPIANWVSVAQFGATPSAEFTDTNDNVPAAQDASAGIQAAFNSGASTIYFPHGVYYLSVPVTIPDTVQRIVGLDSSLHPMQYESWRSEGMFRILANATTPLTIEQLRFDNSNDGTQLALEHISNRTVVIRDVLFPGTLAVNRSSAGGPLFMEDVSAAGSNVTVAGPAIFEARQFNFENCGTCAFVSGTPTVLIGFKEEGDVTEVSATNGALVDVLGGLAYMVMKPTDSATPLFRADSTSTLTASFDEAVMTACCTIANYLDETLSGQNCTTPAKAFPSRSDGGHVVSLLRTGPFVAGPSAETISAAETADLSGISVSDAVAQSCNGTITLSVSDTSGTLEMEDGGGNPVTGSGTNGLLYSGSAAQVNGALATLTYTAALPVATDTVVVNAADQTGASVTADSFIMVGVGPQPMADFSVAASVGSLSLPSGQSGSVTLTVTPDNGFNNPVTLACSSVPIGPACIFSQSPVTPQGAPLQISLTITAPGNSAANNFSYQSVVSPMLWLSTCFLIWLGKNRSMHRAILLFGVLLLPLLGGCHGGTNGTAAPPPTTYEVTMVAASGTLQHSLQISVVVQ